MPEPDPAPSPASTFVPLTARIGSWLARHDPGGIDTNRALHLGAAIGLIIVLGFVAGIWLPANMDVPFPLMAGTGALVSINAVPAADRRTELRTFAHVFALNTACLAVFILIGPGEGPANDMVQKLLLVPLTFAALLLRRYGMPGQRLGIALVVVASVGTILAPTRMEAAILLLAFWIGVLMAVGLRRSPWRPSAVEAFMATIHDMQASVANYLREMSDAVRAGQPFPPEKARQLEALRTRVWNALANATAEAPEARADFEALRVKVYRLRVAVQLLATCIPQDGPRDVAKAGASAEAPSGATPGEGLQAAPAFQAEPKFAHPWARGRPRRRPAPKVRRPPGERWRDPFAAVADHLARWLEDIDADDVHSQDRFARAVARIRVMAFSAEITPAARFALMRALTAFDRLDLVIGGIEQTESAPFPPPHPEAQGRPEPRTAIIPFLVPGPDGRRVLSAPARVAVQGAIAAGLTTALDFAVGLSHAYWATMTVMFVMGNSVGETYVRARYRFVGTLVGVLVGIAFLFLVGDRLLLLALPCTAALAVSVVTARDRYDISSAAVGFSVVLGLHIITGLDTEGMLARIYETAIGALVALAVSWFVLPVYLADGIRPQVKALLGRCRAAFASWWPHDGDRVSSAALMRELRALGERLPHASAESMFGHSAGDLANIISTLDVLLTYLALIEDNSQRLASVPPQEEIVAAVVAARARTLATFDMALGDNAPEGPAEPAPALDAAISTVLDLADDPDVANALPLVADYLAYSDTVLRPLRELAVALTDQSPWQMEKTITGGALEGEAAARA